MKKIFLVLSALFFLSFQCSDSGVNTAENKIITIKTGTSFGMCMGYCIAEAEITKGKIIFTRSSWISDNPAKSITDSISGSDWEYLVNSIDINVVKNLNDVYGCPDCADGGSEWIEFTGNDLNKKITFEHGKTVEPINLLIEELRIIRKKYEELLPR
jgi:hypothetical protein